MTVDILCAEFTYLRAPLMSYLRRLVIRPEDVEDIVQATAVRAIEAGEKAPAETAALRKWLFTIATNLAIDLRRRHSSWRETVMADLRTEAESRVDFLERAAARRGSAEMTAIAREHLVFCFACVLRNLETKRAAVLLLKEVFGFTIEEAAEIVGARFAQVKSWLQEARAYMEEHYDSKCSLLNKRGVCYQCVELDGFFNGKERNPLQDTDGRLEARLAVVRELAAAPPGAWHTDLLGLLDELH